jgi:hypothetical protein
VIGSRGNGAQHVPAIGDVWPVLDAHTMLAQVTDLGFPS